MSGRQIPIDSCRRQSSGCGQRPCCDTRRIDAESMKTRKLSLLQSGNVTLYVSVSCASRFQIIWISAVYVYKAALLAVGLYFTWNTRQVSLLHRESKTKQNTHTPFNGPLSGTTRVSRYQIGKTNLDITGARDSEWQWHQLGMCKSAPHSRQITTPAHHHYNLQKKDGTDRQTQLTRRRDENNKNMRWTLTTDRFDHFCD